jgi:hypothetical protein
VFKESTIAKAYMCLRVETGKEVAENLEDQWNCGGGYTI